MLLYDGSNGPKHVGAIERDILSVSCSILCFNKECICWQKSFEFDGVLHYAGTKVIQNSNHIGLKNYHL
jgi:hypothetical protein